MFSLRVDLVVRKREVYVLPADWSLSVEPTVTLGKSCDS